jgi:hypothetical protein
MEELESSVFEHGAVQFDKNGFGRTVRSLQPGDFVQRDLLPDLLQRQLHHSG